MIARGGFTEEAVEVLHEGKSWSSDFTQLQLLLRQFGIRTEQISRARPHSMGGAETLLAGEYAIAIPMESNTELVAASAIEQIAAQLHFPETARGQIKMAIIEACINAREYGDAKGAISLTVRPADTHLEIIIDNPGQAFDAEAVPEPVLEEKIGSKELRDKRGWGLKLMRNLMDEVIFEPIEDGTRVRLIKRRPDAAQGGSSPVVDVSKE
jgi:anti-sigma regulatory factor (Ser/Thr protein kinase)